MYVSSIFDTVFSPLHWLHVESGENISPQDVEWALRDDGSGEAGCRGARTNVFTVASPIYQLFKNKPIYLGSTAWLWISLTCFFCKWKLQQQNNLPKNNWFCMQYSISSVVGTSYTRDSLWVAVIMKFTLIIIISIFNFDHKLMNLVFADCCFFFCSQQNDNIRSVS